MIYVRATTLEEFSSHLLLLSFVSTFRVTEVDMEDTEAAMEADTEAAMEDMAMGELSLDRLHRVSS